MILYFIKCDEMKLQWSILCVGGLYHVLLYQNIFYDIKGHTEDTEDLRCYLR